MKKAIDAAIEAGLTPKQFVAVCEQAADQINASPAVHAVQPLPPTLEDEPRQTRDEWYEAKTGSHQGLIIEERTGKNIAVTYDKKDAAIIVQACNHHEELVATLELCRDFIRGAHGGEGMSEDERWLLLSHAAIEADSILAKLK